MGAYRNQAYIFRRYLWLYEVMVSKEYVSFEQISELWQRSSLGDGAPLPHKTFENHRKAVEEIFGIEIICNRSTNLYSISSDISKSICELFDSSILLNNLTSMPELKRFVSIERIHVNADFIRTIIEALTEKRQLDIHYRHNYDTQREEKVTVTPIGIKLFRQRWYLIAELPNGSPYTFSFDRLIEVSKNENKKSTDVDVNTLFKNNFGIMWENDKPVTNITLKVDKEEANYFKNLPLHPSQQIILENDTYTLFTLSLSPTYDFIMEILSHGPKVEVLGPESVRRTMVNKITELFKIYHPCPTKDI